MKSGINRNEFKDWFEEQGMVKKLREASTISYESLYQELLGSVSKLKDKAGVGDEISNDVFVLTLLSLLKYVIVSEYNSKVEAFAFHRFTTNSLKPEERFEIPKIAWWEKHADDLDEIINEEKIKSFFKNLCDKTNKEAENTLKRLSKLWDTLPEGYDPLAIIHTDPYPLKNGEEWPGYIPKKRKSLIELMENLDYEQKSEKTNL